MNLKEIKQYIEKNYDPYRPLKGDYLTNDQIDWLIQQAELKERYEKIFKEIKSLTNNPREYEPSYYTLNHIARNALKES
jgi:hypothetical protein